MDTRIQRFHGLCRIARDPGSTGYDSKWHTHDSFVLSVVLGLLVG